MEAVLHVYGTLLVRRCTQHLEHANGLKEQVRRVVVVLLKMLCTPAKGVYCEIRIAIDILFRYYCVVCAI